MSEPQIKFITPDNAAQKLRLICRESAKDVTVIFGAGASRGYSRTAHVYVPPTVAELFDERNNVVSEVLNWQKHDEIED